MLRRLALAAALALTTVAAHAQFATIAPTAAPADNSNRIATTAFVTSAVGGGGSLALASGKIFIGSAGNIATAQTMSADATLAVGGALTLATVNANVGSFGSATNCVSFTTNAKGLITAASATPCTPGIASVTGLGTGVATWLTSATSANLRAAMTDETGTGALYFQGGDIGTPSAGVATNITGLNASNLATGTVPAARGGAGTITGALKGSGAGVVTQAACADLSNGSVGCSATWPAWTTFAPSAVCGTATFTVNSAKAYTLGKTTFVQYDITISAIGTCTSSSSSIALNTPNTLNTGASLNGYDSIGGFFVYCYALPAATAYQCRSSSNMVTNSHFYLAGVYENQ